MVLSFLSLAFAIPCTNPQVPFHVAPDGTAWRWSSDPRRWCLEAVDELGDVHTTARWARSGDGSAPPAVAPLPDGRVLIARPVPGGLWRLARRSACGAEETLPATLPAAPTRLVPSDDGARVRVTVLVAGSPRSWDITLMDGRVVPPSEGPYDATVSAEWP